MDELKRRFLKNSGGLLLSSLIGTGLLVPRTVLAADWNRAAFTAKNVNDALKGINVTTPAESKDLTINAPEIAENGAKVGVEVICHVPNAKSLALFADRNPMPLCATLDFHGAAVPYARVELKIAESTRLRAVVKTHDGKTHIAFRDVKVTLGGCGG